MQKQPIYNVSVHPASKSTAFDRTFLFLPTPDELILVIQDRISEIEAAIQDGDEEDAEHLGYDLEFLRCICEIVAAAKPFECHESGTTINTVTVGRTKVGSIHIHRYIALDKAKRRRK